jgi:hypothetical protein
MSKEESKIVGFCEFIVRIEFSEEGFSLSREIKNDGMENVVKDGQEIAGLLLTKFEMDYDELDKQLSEAVDGDGEDSAANADGTEQG